MTMIGWKNGVRPIMRDRFQKICTETTKRTVTTTTTTATTTKEAKSTLSEKHEVTSSVMETTTKETTSTNLPRRHHLKTRHLTVNTPSTDVTLVKKHGTSIDDLKNKVVNAINAESAKEHGSLTDMALGKHIEPYFNFMLFNSNILFISNRCTY
eukprot:XP_011427231.1 PREDICTED: uncharacterized protein LOC105328162 isoform X2 [Crassostrea gigas]